MANEKDTAPAAEAAQPADAQIALALIETPKIETSTVAMANVEAPKLESPKPAEIKPAPMNEASAPAIASAAGASTAPARSNRFALLAASVAIAAAFGALAGASISGVSQSASATVQTGAPAEVAALQDMLGKLKAELAALRTSLEAGTRNSNVQFAKVTERFDRVERAQAEPAARLAKAIEALERLERRAEVVPARETTGSVTPPPAAAVAQPPQPPIVEGWVVRGVYRGIAIIQAPRLGMVDVGPGDVLPGVGRVESIRKQDGKWVVVTSKGLITSVR